MCDAYLGRSRVGGDGDDEVGLFHRGLDMPRHLTEEDGGCVEREPGRDEALHGLHHRAVHHLERSRHDPGRDDARHRMGGRLDRGKRHEDGGRRRGIVEKPHEHSCDETEGSLRADNDPAEIEPGRVGHCTAQHHHLAVGGDHLHAEHVIDRRAFRETVQTTRIRADVASDRARRL